MDIVTPPRLKNGALYEPELFTTGEQICRNVGVHCVEYKYIRGNPYKHGILVPIDPESPYLLGGYLQEIGRAHDSGTVS